MNSTMAGITATEVMPQATPMVESHNEYLHQTIARLENTLYRVSGQSQDGEVCPKPPNQEGLIPAINRQRDLIATIERLTSDLQSYI